MLLHELVHDISNDLKVTEKDIPHEVSDEVENQSDLSPAALEKTKCVSVTDDGSRVFAPVRCRKK